MRRVILILILPLAFMASCVAFILPAARLADPMTHTAIDAPNVSGPFPVVVVRGAEAWVTEPDPHSIPPSPAGASYLVPIEKVRTIERYLQDHDTRKGDASWVLKVESLGPGRQRIDVVSMNDGFWGGVYDATATTVTPLYRRITGPGFAFVFGPLALLMNSGAWLVVCGGVWFVRRRFVRR